MKTYIVKYNGNAPRFQDFEDTVNAESEREAVESVYQDYLDDNYFPQDDGTIFDCDGHKIADPDDVEIEYDGGNFYAEEEDF